MTAPRWRLGTHYGVHIYEDNRPVATFHNAEDAAQAVAAVNACADKGPFSGPEFAAWARSSLSRIPDRPVEGSLVPSDPIRETAFARGFEAGREQERHAMSGRVREARLAGRLQALREAQAELRRIAVSGGAVQDEDR